MANSASSTPELEKKTLENGISNDFEENANCEKDPCLPTFKSTEIVKENIDSDTMDTKPLKTETNKNSYKLTAGKKRNSRLSRSKLHPAVTDFEKNLQEKTGLSRKGLIIAAIVLFLLFTLVIIVLILSILWPRTPHSQLFPICKKAACLRISAEVLPKMNTSVTRPCDNFRGFACGNWTQNTTLPRNRNEWGLKQRMQYSTRDKIRQLISTMPHPVSSKSFTWKLKYFYDSCMNLDNIESEKSRPLLKIITDLDGWSVLGTFNMFDWDMDRAIKTLHSSFGVNLFFHIDVVPDPRDGQLDIIQISPPELGLPHRSYYYRPQDSSVVVAYKRFLKDTAQTLGATSANADRYSEEIFGFEKRIAEVLPDVRDKEPLSAYNKMTVGDLVNLAPSLQLSDILLAKYPESNINDRMEVIVPYPDYIRHVSVIKSAIDKSTINNYAMSRLAAMYLPYLSQQYREIVTFYRKDMFGENEPPQRWEFCIEVLQKYMGYAVAALLQQHVDSIDAGHTTVNYIFEDIRNSVLRSVRRASWIDQDLRDHLLDKLNGLGFQVGFPEPLLTPHYLNEFYWNMHIQKHDFFQNVLYGVTFLQKYQQRRLRMPAEEHRWTDAMTSPDISVSYVVESNKVILPQALLSEPFFHPEYPAAVLYGNIGVEIGTAIVQGLVPWDVLYAGDGTLLVTEHPAINQTVRAFRYPVSCLRRFWSKEGYAKINVSNTTAYNTLVTISAVKHAYHALKKELSLYPHIHQPALENYENEQLFYITYAQSICSLKSAHKWDLDLTLDKHLDELVLLPIVLSQLREFSETFSCSSGDLLYTDMPCEDVL